MDGRRRAHARRRAGLHRGDQGGGSGGAVSVRVAPWEVVGCLYVRLRATLASRAMEPK
ncbi:hypothetical protein BVI1335_1180003 [Burkholderia vietnamiensis]|nr:hypothetical protein BVI1335_1180003 [Burkholderia vietnamiensis]